MSNTIALTSEYIKKLHPLSVVKDTVIGDHFINKFVAMYGVSKEKAIAFHEREKDNYIKRITENEDLRSCTPMSIFIAYMQVGGWQLSFEGGKQADVYLIMGNVNIGTKDAPVYEKQVIAQPSPYGEKKIRIQNGQIKDADKPVIVYEGDHYKEYLDTDGSLKVEWAKGERTSNKIISSFIRIVKPDGTHEFKTFDMDDVAKWRKSSEQKNSKWVSGVKQPGKANALYTSNAGQIDKLFFEGKTLTHAFKGYSKVVNVPMLSENFKPIASDEVRQGFDVSEFTKDTQDVPHEVIEDAEKDGFTQALDEHQQNEQEPVLTFETHNEEEEPAF